MTIAPPPPGSLAALARGCTCPVLDNGHGRGCGRKDEYGNPLYWIAEGCPVHDQTTPVPITTYRLEAR